jgi:hypothetical protein
VDVIEYTPLATSGRLIPTSIMDTVKYRVKAGCH